MVFNLGFSCVDGSGSSSSNSRGTGSVFSLNLLLVGPFVQVVYHQFLSRQALFRVFENK